MLTPGEIGIAAARMDAMRRQQNEPQGYFVDFRTAGERWMTINEEAIGPKAAADLFLAMHPGLGETSELRIRSRSEES